MQSIIIGDEAGFALNGDVNSHNVREYAPKGNPPAFNFVRTNSRAKLAIWAAFCGNGVILEPYFFYGNVNGLAYLRMLNEFAFPQLAIHFNNQFWERLFRGLWLAQDGAPAHRLIEVRIASMKYSETIVSLRFNIMWNGHLARLWGYLKNKVFTTPPENIDVLRQRIIEEFNA